MDKNAIKTFAVESRRKMIESVKYQASLIGITVDGITEPISKAEGMETYDYGAGTYTIYDEDIEKRKSLVREIKNKGFDNVVEEVAYTWFNRIIAIRYMEVNDYLPTRTRVLSSEDVGKSEPDIVTEALDLDLDYSEEDIQKILKYEDDNEDDKLFQFLFIKQCNKLNEILPGLFEKTDDYMELMLNISFIDSANIVPNLISSISEEYFEQVEIIGWLYQYYISERKNEVVNVLKSKSIQKNNIPAATQLFTPKWIVEYMVDNSLGRYWIERKKNSVLKEKLSFYFDEVDQNESVYSQMINLRSNDISPLDIKFLDPCMGSGHILVYAFDIFYKIYKELGYSDLEIPSLILNKNLYGLDIDNRAYQMAYFAIMMKGRAFDKQLFNKEIELNILSFSESNIPQSILEEIYNFDSNLGNSINYFNNIFSNAKEFGSLIEVKNMDFTRIRNSLEDFLDANEKNLIYLNIQDIVKNQIIPLINQAEILSLQYDIVVTNPPYMNKFDSELKKFSVENFKDYSRDLFSMFIYRNMNFCKIGGYVAFMTPMVWMFLKGFEKLRNFIISEKSFSSFIEFEYHTLWEMDAHVPACTFVLGNFNYNKEYNAHFLKLSEFTGGLEVQRMKTLEALNSNVDYDFISNSKNFENMPSCPIAYWADSSIVDAFKSNESLEPYFAFTRQGMATSDNKRFLRFWFEINYNKFGPNCSDAIEAQNINKKWYPFNKGGNYRKWYGNQDYVINYENDGFELKEYARQLYKSYTRSIRSIDQYFKPCLSWSSISTGNISFRYYPKGFIFASAGSSIFFKNKYYINYIFGFLNSHVSQTLLDLISPTLNYSAGYISLLPIKFDEDFYDEINELVTKNIILCKEDWDDYENSWDFNIHPFIRFEESKLFNIFQHWETYKFNQFNLLKSNEIRLNEIFAEIYELKYERFIEERHISITLANLEKDIRSYISYAVGCMFGRYSLDEEGLQFAGGEFNLNNYSKFIPDDDNIIPVLDTEYFNDDIVGRFVEFVKVCFGEETLEENLDFIAGALKKKGKTSREIIRNYFLTDFFKDHAQTYKKCPIYWQFDSGKQNAFKCLIYMHRYESGLVARVRTDYLHKTQKAIEQNLAQCESIIANSSNKSEISKAKKDKTKYIKQLDEIKVYDEALAHIANQRIEIDLDDGVKVNHAKFQNVEISKEGQKAKKINLLKKI